MPGKLNLLLGAGFSRNWGGWLAQELHGELLGRLRSNPTVYQRLLATQNFETVLFDLQTTVRQSQTLEANANLLAMEIAIHLAFSDMNQHFFELTALDFGNVAENKITRFMSRFDRIFTLNQDLLLELKYHAFDGAMQHFPGVRIPVGWSRHTAIGEDQSVWYPEGDVREEKGSQPIYKLHGSTNWRESAGDTLMVMGGGKAAAIERSSLLRRYGEAFKESLTARDAKLMVIGYGFQDEHINAVITEASERQGLSIYLIDPRGLSMFDPPAAQAISTRNPLRDLRYVGISTRTLRETFTTDTLQRRSLERFLAP